MTGLPKQRVSKGRRGRRRANQRLTAPALHACPQCHEQKLLHHVCPSCGYYRGRKVIATRADGEGEAAS